jgi:hypothetical protein
MQSAANSSQPRIPWYQGILQGNWQSKRHVQREKPRNPVLLLKTACTGQGIAMGWIREKLCRFSESISPKAFVISSGRCDRRLSRLPDSLWRQTGRPKTEPAPQRPPASSTGNLQQGSLQERSRIHGSERLDCSEGPGAPESDLSKTGWLRWTALELSTYMSALGQR